jgi:hypothetical protein
LVAHSGDVERVEAQLGVLAAGADNVLDPLGRIGADQADLGAAVLAETVEELLQCLLVTSGVRPQQHAGVVVDHHGQVLVAALVADLVDPDPAEVREPVGGRLGVGHHPGHDGPDRAPRDAQQLAHRRLRTMRHQPRRGVIERVGVPGAVAGPRHLGSDHAMLSAAHPRRVSLEERPDRAEVQRPPPSPALALVITRAALPAAAAPPLRTLARPDRHDDALVVLVEGDVLNDSLHHPEKPSP